MALERSQCHQESHGLQGNSEVVPGTGKVSLGARWPWRTGRGLTREMGSCNSASIFLGRHLRPQLLGVRSDPSYFRPNSSLCRPTPQRLLVLYIWLWTQETMRKVFPYIGTLPVLGSFLPKGIWAQLNHHPPLCTSIMARTGAWGRIHRHDRKSQRRAHESPAVT